MSPKRKAADAEQSRAFIEAARELGCEENFGRFDDALRRIGAVRPKASGSAETAAEKGRREEAAERGKAAGRKATEGSRGERRRGGGLKEKDPA
jgi:hypothetical protein